MLFLLIVLHGKVEMDPEMKKESCFGTPRGVLACPLTFRIRTTPFGGFQNYFGLSHSLATYSYF